MILSNPALDGFMPGTYRSAFFCVDPLKFVLTIQHFLALFTPKPQYFCWLPFSSIMQIFFQTQIQGSSIWHVLNVLTHKVRSELPFFIFASLADKPSSQPPWLHGYLGLSFGNCWNMLGQQLIQKRVDGEMRVETCWCVAETRCWRVEKVKFKYIFCWLEAQSGLWVKQFWLKFRLLSTFLLLVWERIGKWHMKQKFRWKLNSCVLAILLQLEWVIRPQTINCKIFSSNATCSFSQFQHRNKQFIYNLEFRYLCNCNKYTFPPAALVTDKQWQKIGAKVYTWLPSWMTGFVFAWGSAVWCLLLLKMHCCSA